MLVQDLAPAHGAKKNLDLFPEEFSFDFPNLHYT